MIQAYLAVIEASLEIAEKLIEERISLDSDNQQELKTLLTACRHLLRSVRSEDQLLLMYVRSLPQESGMNIQ